LLFHFLFAPVHFLFEPVHFLFAAVCFLSVISKGDRTTILSSGFSANQERRKRGSAPTIETLEVELGPPGEATTRVRNVKGVRAYVHQYTMEPPTIHTEWVAEGSSDGSYTFEGLQSEKRYWFRVLGIGSRKQITYSPVVSRVIQ
jgi:hypothetical protein